MEGTFKFSDTLLSPVKGYTQSDDARTKQETNYNNLFSPYPQDIKTPMKDSDWGYYQKKVNGETPIIGSRIFSPILSSNQQKIGYGTYSIHPRMLFNDCSPFKPQVVLSTPYQNNQNSIDKDRFKENKNDFMMFQCKNLAMQFDSVAHNELSLIENNDCPDHFTQIKQRLFNDINYTIGPNINRQEQQESQMNTIVCFGTLNYDLFKSFNKRKESDGIDNDDNRLLTNSNNSEGEEAKEVSYFNPKLYDIPNKREVNCLECKCAKSKCLKLYCECFANGKYCKGCSCVNCLNTIEYETHRRKAYNKIVSKNPKALQKIQSNKKSWNCKCKNSSCQKNYCDCFQNNKFCSSKCKCFDCRNKPLAKRARGCFKKNKKPILSHIKKKKKSKEEAFVPVASTLHHDAIYTPQKKNYRSLKSEFQNSISTAAYTALSVDNKPRRLSQRNHSNVCKKLDLKDDGQS